MDDFVTVQIDGDSGPYVASIREVEAGVDVLPDAFGDRVLRRVPRTVFEEYERLRKRLLEVEDAILSAMVVR